MGFKELLTEIEKQVHEECLSKSCKDEGCRVYLTDTPPDRVIVNLECEFKQRKRRTKRCDYIIFCGNAPYTNLVVILIELKGGDFETPEVTAQLQKGSDFVIEVFEKLPKEANAALNTLEITCVPALFHGKGIDRFQLRELERAKVSFFNQKLTIKRRKCGEPKNLALVLKG